MEKGALKDVKILDLTRVLSGPFAAMWLGDLGADVIKIETPKVGDDARFTPIHVNGNSTFFAAINRNKRSVTLNLKSPEAIENLPKVSARTTNEFFKEKIAVKIMMRLVKRLLLPDEPEELKAALITLCDRREADLILTTGGTGFAPRDQTPEATSAVIERPVPGIPEAMRWYSLQITPRGCLSRGVAGIRKNTLIVNLPGSPRACRENLQPVLPAISHGLKMLLQTMTECAENAKD